MHSFRCHYRPTAHRKRYSCNKSSHPSHQPLPKASLRKTFSRLLNASCPLWSRGLKRHVPLAVLSLPKRSATMTPFISAHAERYGLVPRSAIHGNRSLPICETNCKHIRCNSPQRGIAPQRYPLLNALNVHTERTPQ